MVAFADSFLVGGEDMLATRESTRQHKQCRFREMKVGDQNIDDLEVETWGDEKIHVAGETFLGQDSGYLGSLRSLSSSLSDL